MAFSIFHGSIRKKLVLIVFLATFPAIILLAYTNFEHQADHLASSEKDITISLHSFSEVQRRITDSTKTLLATISQMPEIKRADKIDSTRILGSLLKANPIYTNVILLDVQGKVVAMGKGKDKGFDFSDRKQFIDAKRTKKFSFGEFVVGKATKQSIFPFAMPVLSDDGDILGVIIIGVSLQHYGELFEHSGLPEGSFFGLCDYKGTRVFRYPVNPNLPIGTPIKQKVFQLVDDSGLAGTMSLVTSDNVDRIIAYEPLRIDKDGPPYMYMFMGLDKKRLVVDSQAELVRGLSISALSIVCAVLLAWALGWKIIAAKIDRLAAFALKIGQGDRVPPSREDYSDGELGQLFESFDTMVSLLKKREEDLTNAKKTVDDANRALRLNMSHFRTLMETMPELVWVKDAAGVYMFCNNRFERFFGASEAEIIGKTDHDFVDAELADSFRRNDIAAMNAGKSTVNEETVTYADDGHVEDLETIKTPMYDDGGQLIGVLGVARDITDRKRISDELRESEMRFKALHNASFGGIAIHDKGVILDCNQGLSDVSGYAIDELVGMNGLLLIAESAREMVMANIIAGYEKPYEAVGLRRNGEEYPVLLEARNIPYKGQDVRAVEFRDITGQKKAEAELRDSELRHRVIFENSPLGMVRFSGDGVILDCNDNFVELMGSSKERLIGFNSSRKSSPEMRQAINRALAGEPSSFEDYYTSVTGNKESYLHVVFNPVNIGQSPTEVIATLEDVSERKRVQDELQAAKEQAENFSQSKTEFLTNMSHEIRTPLNGILGMLQLMQTTGLNTEQMEYVTDAISSSKRLTTLLTDILDLSRVEAGKLVVQHKPFDLLHTLKNICDLYKLTAEQTGVSLLCEFGDDLPQVVMGDSLRLQQVITNLIGNSYKFTDNGRVSFTAHQLHTPGTDKTRVLFIISDTGLGIPEDKLDTLFDSFTQVDQGFTREHQGAGLGLAICKRLVTLMNGSLSIESMVGEGTKLYVSIPFELGQEKGLESIDVNEQLVTDSESLKILLAEDERVNSLVTKRLLEKAGHDVEVVYNGKEAVESVHKHDYDVIMMDIQMPVMDGVEATQAIRNGDAGDDRKDIPIIAVTAYAMVGDKEKFMEAGMDGYVVKPIELDNLQTVLNEIKR